MSFFQKAHCISDIQKLTGKTFTNSSFKNLITFLGEYSEFMHIVMLKWIQMITCQSYFANSIHYVQFVIPEHFATRFMVNLGTIAVTSDNSQTNIRQSVRNKSTIHVPTHKIPIQLTDNALFVLLWLNSFKLFQHIQF